MSDAAQVQLGKAAKRRREQVQAVVGGDVSVLEIGALDSPMFVEGLGDRVKHLDWFSREELHEQHKDNPRRRVTNLVNVDYVIKSHKFAPSIGERFDLIVAAHVVEHVADIVFWLQQLESLLLPGGSLYLAVPDRRYTFDYYRRTSSVIDMIRAHEACLDRPDKWQIADAIYHYSAVDRDALWDGGSPPPFAPRFSLPEALRRADKRARTYADVHCWVFTPESFAEVITQLRSSGFVNLEIARLEEPRRNTSEFTVFLSVA